MSAATAPNAQEPAAGESAIAPLIATRLGPKHSWVPLVVTLMTLALALLVIWRLQVVADVQPARTNQRFVLPEGFSGALRVYYGIDGAPPLPVENGWRLIEVPRSGIVETSSAIEYGKGLDVIVRRTPEGELATLEPQRVKRRIVGISGDTHEWANHALEIRSRDLLIQAGNWKSAINGQSLVGKPYEILYIRDDF